jgi:hypothetical protein
LSAEQHQARREAIRSWRQFAADPEHTEDMRRHALDLLGDHFARVAPQEVELLEDDEREAYIAFLADSLGAGLLRYIAYWIVNDFPTVEEWRAT